MLTITPTDASHFDSLYRVLDAVARERRYLAMLEAPPREAAMAFFRNIVDHGLCQFVAIEAGDVVGWCDVLPVFGSACAHVGTLGMGLLPAARHRGIGAKLLGLTLAEARTQGFTRVQLTVRADNINARRLYERFGFEVEGLQRRAFRVDGEYFDCHAMALVG